MTKIRAWATCQVITTQQKTKNAPCLELCCYGMDLVSTNESTVSGRIWTNENAQLWPGVLLDWEGLVLNTECVKKTVIVVSRLVKGRLSDSVKTVRIAVPRSRTNFTLALPCEDLLPYSIQVTLSSLSSN